MVIPWGIKHNIQDNIWVGTDSKRIKTIFQKMSRESLVNGGKLLSWIDHMVSQMTSNDYLQLTVVSPKKGNKCGSVSYLRGVLESHWDVFPENDIFPSSAVNLWLNAEGVQQWTRSLCYVVPLDRAKHLTISLELCVHVSVHMLENSSDEE